MHLLLDGLYDGLSDGLILVEHLMLRQFLLSGSLNGSVFVVCPFYQGVVLE